MTTQDRRRLSSDRKKRQAKMDRIERVRLRQFTLCFFLFLSLFIGKGVFPEKISTLRDDVLSFIGRDIDFKGALTKLGESLSNSEAALCDLGEFCVDVFGPQTEAQPTSNEDTSLPSGYSTAQAKLMLSKHTVPYTLDEYCSQTESTSFCKLIEQLKENARPPKVPAEPPAPPVEAAATPAPAGEESAVPAAGTVLLKVDCHGEEPPQRYTMDHISLGPLDTMTPVAGHLTSSYGYRTHPISGKHIFHGGIDIGSPMGTTICAFANGTVEYTGEDQSYGKYLQLDHGNGVKSFYAHCSKLCVQKGQVVTKGEKVAEVGSTGTSTGPHLHLELKYNKLHLNPAYYVKLTEQT